MPTTSNSTANKHIKHVQFWTTKTITQIPKHYPIKKYSVTTLIKYLSMPDYSPYILNKIIHLPPGILRQLIGNQNQNIFIDAWLRVYFHSPKPIPEINVHL
jgi:hypothetical protein